MHLSQYPLYRYVQCTRCTAKHLVKNGTTIQRVLEDMRRDGWRRIPWPKGMRRTTTLTFATATCPRCVEAMSQPKEPTDA